MLVHVFIVARGMLLVKAFLKIFGVCSKLMKFALKRRKFAFLNRNKDADWREGENKKEGAAWSVSSPSPSPSVPPLPLGELANPKDLTERASPLKKKHLQQEFVDFLRAQTNVQMLFTLCAIVLCNNFFC